MFKKLGFIGNGNMAQAMISGIIGSGSFKADQILVSGRSKERLLESQKKYGVGIESSNKELAGKVDYLVLAVKPDQYKGIIGEIRDGVSDDLIVVSIAAGISLEDIRTYFAREIKLAKAMPNTPSLVGEGMTALSFGEGLNDSEKAEVIEILSSFGKVELVDEGLMDGVTAISGSSPAYVYMFIEALADGGVLEGLKRDQAYRMAAQAVLGSAKMVLETGEHPGELKDRVCSPGGTTIEAVGKLEEKGFRDSVISAMRTCADKSRKMSDKG